MFSKIQLVCEELVQNFDSISTERKAILVQLSAFIQTKIDSNKPIQLMYVCTHNSRRSHFGQIWSAVAAHYFSIPNVISFSGGTEATAFNASAIQVLTETGFEISSADFSTENPRYTVRFGENKQLICFSKIYDDPANPKSAFAAIMTCSDAEADCPYIPGVELRIATTYDDPKNFDNTPLQAEKYMERMRQIALETMFVFSLLIK